MLYDWLSERHHVDPKRMAVVGRSLGSGVAVQVAMERDANSIVLITPYDSILAIAKRKFKAIPVEYVLQHKFESIKYARTSRRRPMCCAPVRTISCRIAYRPAGGKTGELHADEIVPDSDHLNIPYLEATQTRIASFQQNRCQCLATEW
jgi:hypothetical protein